MHLTPYFIVLGEIVIKGAKCYTLNHESGNDIK